MCVEKNRRGLNHVTYIVYRWLPEVKGGTMGAWSGIRLARRTVLVVHVIYSI